MKNDETLDKIKDVIARFEDSVILFYMQAKDSVDEETMISTESTESHVVNGEDYTYNLSISIKATPVAKG